MESLVQAASKGDVEYLKKVFVDDDGELNPKTLSNRKEALNGNFIRRAVKMNNYTFLFEALKNLPANVVVDVVSQIDKLEGSNTLHIAAKEGNIFTMKLLVSAYISASIALGNLESPPWLAKNNSGHTPIHICCMKKVNKSCEYIARYLLSRDHHLVRSLGEQRYSTSPDQSSTMAVDKTGASIFFCAMREGFSLLAVQILTSGLPYSLSGTYGENPLHHASKCNEKVSKLLLERHPELIGKEPGFGGTVLDRAVEDNAEWLVKLMLLQDEGTIGYCPRPWNKACRRLIWHINPKSSGDTPLHIAARKGYTDIARLLVQGYESAIRDEAEEWDVAEAHPVNNNLGVTPLHIENSVKELPLIVALKEKHDDLGLYLLSVTTILNVAQLKDVKGKTAYEIAVENGCDKSSKTILEIIIRRTSEYLSMWGSNVNILHPSILKIVHHFASLTKFTSDSVARLVVEGVPMFAREPEKDAKVHLKEAAERNADWLVTLLLEGDNSLIHDSTPAWQMACAKGHLSTLLAFLASSYQQEFVEHCRDIKDTPLHHIKLSDYEEYKILMENPTVQELMNQVDSVGTTPLHRAIEQYDFGLIKALLETEGIQLNIEDQNRRTVLDLLEEKLKTSDNFFQLYKELLQIPLMTEELKNRVDSNGATSLHRAIKRNDLELTIALLETKGVRLDIANQNHKTALDLLEERCITSDEFFEFYKLLLAHSLITNELKNRIDNNGATPLHRAIVKNVRRLVKALVETKGVTLEMKDANGKTALDLIEERCSIKSVDRYWYDMYKKLLLNSDRLHRMKNRRGSTGSTPFHVALEWDDLMLVKTLVRTKGIQVNIKDNNGKMALDLIEERCYPPDSVWYDLYEELLTSNLVTYEMTNRVDVNGATSLQRAIEQNANKLVKMMMRVNGVEIEIKDKNGTTAVDMIKEKCKDKSADVFWFERYKEILTNPDLLQKMKNHRGNSGVTPLHIAILWDDLKLTKKLVQSKGIELSIKDTKGKTALDLIEEKCNESDSLWYELYKDLLDNRNYLHELKNRRVGIDKETPLHRAIKWDDIKLAKVLLETKGVELDIEDKNGITALDLLEERYTTGKWGELCREIRLDPSLKIFKFKYLQRRTSLKDMHNTLSVVAALLATITFAAGFTVPGGLDNNDGTATLGKHAAFLVFSVTNTLAMCSSMVVLFTVIGAMIWEAHPKATPLIDFCVSLLQLSLCGTIVAFMTGVYAIMAPKVIWAAIVVIVLCSYAFFVALIVVSSFWPLLYKPFKLLKGVVCKLASHVQRWLFCGQQSGQPHDDPTMSALERNEPCSTAEANTLVINPGSDSSTTLGDSFQRNERQLSSNMDQSQRMNEALESLKIDINES